MASYSQPNPGNYGRQSPTNDQPPAPHVIFHSQNDPTNGNPSNVPVYVTSPTENAFPRSTTHSPLRANGYPSSRGAAYAGTAPYSRETPSAPPSMHPTARSWLQTNNQRSPTGANGVSSGNGW
ncbi:hypothetical protein BS47DRAFT_1342396 [Hydnum rufescens UP504]|uniref:Uncharacterized protein n=1 Tax=Hydnum rufescens UP504 TaxID=1448309 RepID=A0A9P6AZR0_9AGAM|nr:hypothetical protein BS47DRAFT_1342396 [Hydnum rufescens UP504]